MYGDQVVNVTGLGQGRLSTGNESDVVPIISSIIMHTY